MLDSIHNAAIIAVTRFTCFIVSYSVTLLLQSANHKFFVLPLPSRVPTFLFRFLRRVFLQLLHFLFIAESFVFNMNIITFIVHRNIRIRWDCVFVFCMRMNRFIKFHSVINFILCVLRWFVLCVYSTNALCVYNVLKRHLHATQNKPHIHTKTHTHQCTIQQIKEQKSIE